MKNLIIDSILQLARRPIYWVSMFLLPFLCFFLISDLMQEGLPQKLPAAIVDNDQSSLSHRIGQNLGSMQMVNLSYTCNSYTEAKKLVQEGKIFGFFFIPENFRQELLAGNKPTISFYTNMTYYVPGTLLYKNFKSTAVYTKAGMASQMLESSGLAEMAEVSMQPIAISTHPIGNPWLNYSYYLGNSFMPTALQLMIFLVTTFFLMHDIKTGHSVRVMQMANGSIVKAVFARLLPQTIIWWVTALFLESWRFGWNSYPMNGSWFWLTLSELMYVLACQGFALFVSALVCNLRMALSVCALIGVLTFSIGCYSFPYENMYGGIAIFSWIVPARFNFLIYIDQALNGIDIYWSRWWYIAYILFMLLPLTVLWKLKRNYLKPIYIP